MEAGTHSFFIVVHIYDMSKRGRESGLHRKSILQFLGMLYLVCLILKAGSGREAEELMERDYGGSGEAKDSDYI